jgi:hypothetical protein
MELRRTCIVGVLAAGITASRIVVVYSIALPTKGTFRVLIRRLVS